MGYNLPGDGDLEFWDELYDEDVEVTEDDDDQACADVSCELFPHEVAASPSRPGFLPGVWSLFRRRGRD